MSDVFAKWNDEMGRMHGLTRLDAPACPMVAMGERCRREIDDEVCYCADRSVSGMRDHAAIWIDDDGRNVLTYEPYAQDGRAVVEMLEYLHALGLETVVDGRSPWSRGDTFLVMVRCDGR